MYADVQGHLDKLSNDTMSLRSLARLVRGVPLASSEQPLLDTCNATTPLRVPLTDLLLPSNSLLSWLQSCQQSLWLAAPKRKVGLPVRCTDLGVLGLPRFVLLMQVSPHRRGMRNAGKHQKIVPVVSRCR